MEEKKGLNKEEFFENLKKLDLDSIELPDELPEELLEKVAGGVVIPEEKCKDTFKDKENCWFNDGCDYTINSYNTYKCKHLPH